MWLTSELNDIVDGRFALGVNITMNSEDNTIVDVILVKKKNNMLSVIYKNTFESLEQFFRSISKKFPIYLSIDGKGIIHKILETENGEILLDRIFPAADKNELFIQQGPAQGNKRTVSITRNKYLSSISQQFIDAGLNLISIVLGPFSIINILSQFEDWKLLELNEYKISINNGFIYKVEKISGTVSEFKFEVDSNEIESRYLAPFTNCLYHFQKNTLLINDSLRDRDLWNKFLNKRLIKLYGWSFLIILFISVALNYYLNTRFKNKNEELGSQLRSYNEILLKTNELKIQLINKEKIYKNFNWQKNRLYSYHIDRIAREIPIGITLNKLIISPRVKSNISENSYKFQDKRILISGNAIGSSQLDICIKNLKKNKWLKEILIRNFSRNDLGTAEFDLEIELE